MLKKKQNKPDSTPALNQRGLYNSLFFYSTNKWQFHIAYEELEEEEEHEFH